MSKWVIENIELIRKTYVVEAYEKSAAILAAKAQAPTKVETIINNPEKLLITILTGNTLVNVAIASLAAIITHDIATEYKWPDTLAIFVEIIVISIVILIFGEILPKVIALRNSEKFADLNGAALVGEYDVKADGTTVMKLWHWK